MQRKLFQLMAIMLIIVIAGIFISRLTKQDSDMEAMKSDGKIIVVTTIYPVYLIGLNLTDGIDNIEVKSLINRNTGCLHDYQLTAEDMKVISSADIMVINGGGMEGFLQDITDNYPDLEIIDAGEGIDLLKNTESPEENATKGLETEPGHDEEKYNSHVWLDPVLYKKQIENVRDELIDYINTQAEAESNIDAIVNKLNRNADRYMEQVQTIEDEVENCKAEIKSDTGNSKQQAVIFHEAFAYLANRMDIAIAFSIELGPDTSLSAGRVAEIVNEIKKDDIHYLFTEEQYSTSIPKQIAEETDAKVYVIDSVVTGDGTKDSYLKAMQNNLQVIREASKNV